MQLEDEKVKDHDGGRARQLGQGQIKKLRLILAAVTD